MKGVENIGSWTYGAEHEWGDWDRAKQLPEGYGIDERDVTMVNSNGIAVDPKGKMYPYGGEINTPPTPSILSQVAVLRELNHMLPEADVNYRSNLHIHIRVPGLGTDLQSLKIIQSYIHANMTKALQQIQPLPRPEPQDFGTDEEWEGALRRWKRRRVSHQTLLRPERLARQLDATTLGEFYEREVPSSKAGRPQWHFQPRLCVNLRQHRETDTIEFRHFAGTKDLDTFHRCLKWCRDFLIFAFEDLPIEQLLGHYPVENFPKFPEYVHWQELRYRATTHDHSLKKHEIQANIDQILKGEFDDLDG